MQSVLFVCLGNICRSPLAQGLFEHKIESAGLAPHFDADSAGTSGWHEGEPPHSGSIAVARKYGISIEKQRSRPVHAKDGEIFDFIIAMDASNRDSLLHEFRFPKEKIHLMRDFSLAPNAKKGLAVPDPWGKTGEAFETVYAILDEAIGGFIAFLREQRKG
ncbi:low molecular weight protein-tyrosine-phosphatase [Turneriella parva]|uniref:protein-tyrosine-phosphatase n=1 Tax=Turneriella parva (strain ATCC BAA-1111 / DSM 21527 / NCTC 11395 / H) TaxID=869212 RepID=I4BBD2_TURPD|nr:low molecular weight protein-tyrosine-phosphatase [Turneriella parva]AFM14589.1 protein tyrosine phosphatase [Turneriella parva DSM 21527]